MRPAVFLLLGLIGLAACRSVPPGSAPAPTAVQPPKPSAALVAPSVELVKCRGRVVGFTPNGAQFYAGDGPCQWADVTAVVILEPVEYAGLHHGVMTSNPDHRPLLGAPGQVIDFQTSRQMLELEQHPEGFAIDSGTLIRDLSPAKKAVASTPPGPLPEGPAVSTFKASTPSSVRLRREQLVGSWYGDQPTKEGGRKQWIMRRRDDGTFRIAFRFTDASGAVSQQTEVGEWGVNANLLITQTKGWLHGTVVDEAPTDSYFWDVYELLVVEPDHLQYRTVESGNEYRVRKVAEGFDFPP